MTTLKFCRIYLFLCVFNGLAISTPSSALCVATFLGKPKADLGLTSYPAQADEQPNLLDHALGTSAWQTPIFPGAGVASLLLAAAEREKISDTNPIIQLGRFSIDKPIYVVPGMVIDTIIQSSAAKPDRFSGSVKFRGPGQSDADTFTVATRECKFLPAADTLHITSPSEKTTTYTHTELYDWLSDIGLRYGPSLRLVQQVHVVGDYAEAAIEIPDISYEGTNAPHFTTIDAAFHVVLVALKNIQKDQFKLSVPTRFMEVNYNKNVVLHPGFAIVRVRIMNAADLLSENPPNIRYQLELMNSDGEVAMWINNSMFSPLQLEDIKPKN